jgi:hypothetical protein
LKEKSVYTTEVHEFLKLDIADELIQNYDVYKPISRGPNKGKLTDTKDIYRSVPFGAKKAEKYSESAAALNSLLDSHPMYRDRFMLNATLVDFNMIPEDIQSDIIDAYNETEVNYNPNGMLNYFMNEGLGEMVNAISKFHDNAYESQKTSSLDDFLRT